MSRAILVKGGRVIDPLSGRDEEAGLFIEDGLFAPIPDVLPRNAMVADAEGLVVAPGFVDIHVHLREPGGEQAETIESGSRAAAHGGFTTVVAMPNTDPPLDTPGRVRETALRGRDVGLVRVLTAACITMGRAGTELTDFRALVEAGAVAFTDDGRTVADPEVMLRAMIAARKTGRPILDHSQDAVLAAAGVIRECAVAVQNGFPSIPAEAELAMVRRDIELAAKTGCRVHVQHVSTEGAIQMLREAMARNPALTCEVTPHHLALSTDDIVADNACYKVNPPLGLPCDRDALADAVSHGTVTAFATDHAPHTRTSKELGFSGAPFGMIGLETAIGVTYTVLVETGKLDLGQWIRMWTAGPLRALGLSAPSLELGSRADLVALDLGCRWQVRAGDFRSRSQNSPFLGRELKGSAAFTIMGGMLTWRGVQGRVDTRGRL